MEVLLVFIHLAYTYMYINSWSHAGNLIGHNRGFLFHLYTSHGFVRLNDGL